MRTRLICILFVVLTACGIPGDDDTAPLGAPPPDAPSCPAVKPDQGTACAVPASAPACEYLIEACSCGPSDIEWSCTCQDGAWDCSRGYDCYPCPDAAAS